MPGRLLLAMADRLSRHNQVILVKAEQSAARRLREKASEAEREARRGAARRRAGGASRVPLRRGGDVAGQGAVGAGCRGHPARSSNTPWPRHWRRSRSSPSSATPAWRSPRRQRPWTLAAAPWVRGRRRTPRASAAASGRPPSCSSPTGTSPSAASASPRATRTPLPWRAPCACACGRAASRPSSAEQSFPRLIIQVRHAAAADASSRLFISS